MLYLCNVYHNGVLVVDGLLLSEDDFDCTIEEALIRIAFGDNNLKLHQHNFPTSYSKEYEVMGNVYIENPACKCVKTLYSGVRLEIKEILDGNEEHL